MYNFYIIQSPFNRVGFGITQDAKERNKQYCSHCGGIVKFTHVYSGLRAHAKALERTIKTQYVDNIWKLDDWQTEWLNDDITVEKLQQYVEQLIKERNIKLSLTKTDFDFTQAWQSSKVSI